MTDRNGARVRIGQTVRRCSDGVRGIVYAYERGEAAVLLDAGEWVTVYAKHLEVTE